MKLLNDRQFICIRELQRKFTSTFTIGTNTEGCPTSVSCKEEMILNGRIMNASEPLAFGSEHIVFLHAHVCILMKIKQV